MVHTLTPVMTSEPNFNLTFFFRAELNIRLFCLFGPTSDSVFYRKSPVTLVCNSTRYSVRSCPRFFV